MSAQKFATIGGNCDLRRPEVKAKVALQAMMSEAIGAWLTIRFGLYLMMINQLNRSLLECVFGVCERFGQETHQADHRWIEVICGAKTKEVSG